MQERKKKPNRKPKSNKNPQKEKKVIPRERHGKEKRKGLSHI